MKRNELRAGVQYMAAAGDWIFEIESIDRTAIYYTVLQTGQKCQAHPAEFAERVKRPVMLVAESNRQR